MKLRKLFAAACLLLASGAAMAQMMPAIPVDKEVKIGHLDNGLTYYIRHNNYPEHVASFYIAQKVGSINENDDQRGLAHLLEHLAFNGSEHFKDNNLQEYLQSIGVEYGRNLNAYTSIDQTVYYFTDVPTTRISAVDSCMLILKDWSNGITLSKQAIEDERDVVHNEYRMSMIGQQRIFERALPKLYPGSKYGYRMPIGLMSVVDGCNPETLRAYYRKWYRPDNQAIIVVGDVDVNHIEAQIKKLFGGIKVPANAAKVVPEPVPDNDKAIYVVDKDKEMQYDLFQILMKQDAIPDSLKNGVDYLVKGYLDNVFASMMNARFSEKAQDPSCPYLQASSSYGEYLGISRTKDALGTYAVVKEGQVKEAYAAVLRELKRVRDFGFTATEYQRAKEDYMSSIEKAYTNRDKMKNEQFTSQYVDNFISNEPIPSVADEYQIDQMLVPNIPVEAVNGYAKQIICDNDTNFVTLVMMHEADGKVYPTEQELANIVKEVRSEKLEAYVDNVKQEPLIAQKPKAGKIKSTTENKQLGFKTLTLSNGAKVILKKTDFKNDEIRFSASANVGYSSFPKSDYIYTLATSLMDASGLGSFSSNELEKALAGKQVHLGTTMSPFKHGLGGSSTPKDIETLMQLIYLKMTAISKDDKSVANLKNTLQAVLANQSKDPNMVYQDSLQSTIYMGNKLARIPTADDIKTIDYDRVLQMAKQFYGNAKDFTFYFVGNFDEATLLPLIEQYIASLPNNGFKAKNQQIPVALGEVKNVFTKSMENPQSQATEIWFAKTPYTLQTSVLADISARMLQMDYLRNIREKLSAAYHAEAEADMSVDYDGKLAISLTGGAQLNPDKLDEAMPYFFSGLKNTIDNPSASDLQKVKEILQKQADVNAKNNGYWMGILRTYIENGVDIYTNYKTTVASTNGKSISDFLQNVILKTGNHIEVIMKAVKDEAGK